MPVVFNQIQNPNIENKLLVLKGAHEHKSYQEMADIIHKSKRTIQLYLERLENEGYIIKPEVKQGRAKKRSIVLTDKGIALLKQHNLLPEDHD